MVSIAKLQNANSVILLFRILRFTASHERLGFVGTNLLTLHNFDNYGLPNRSTSHILECPINQYSIVLKASKDA